MTQDKSELFKKGDAVRLELLEPGLRRPPLLVAGEHFVHGGNEPRVTRREALLHEVGLFAEKADIKHGADTLGGRMHLGNRRGIFVKRNEAEWCGKLNILN